MLSEKIKVHPELINKSIARIDRQNQESVYWSEFLISLTEEGKRREVVADAQLFGFGTKRFAFKDAYSLKAATDEKLAEYYIHKMVVVHFENTPYLIAFSEDQKVKVYEANTFKKVQDIKFSSNYGQMNCKCDFKTRSFDPKCACEINAAVKEKKPEPI